MDHIIRTKYGNLKVKYEGETITSVAFTHKLPTTDVVPPIVVQSLIRLTVRPDTKQPIKHLPMGTPFQTQVWEEIQKIPVGTTITYQELATRLNRVTSSRAVARACNANKLLFIVPCHRVVGTRNIGGFSAGVKTKQAILDYERAYLDLIRPQGDKL